MPAPFPIVLVPGLNCSARLYAEQIPALWRFGPVQVADHTAPTAWMRSPPTFLRTHHPALRSAGLSMGGYIALTMLRQAPARVSQARVARHLGATRDAGAERAAQAADRARARRALRRGPGAAVSNLRSSRPPGRRGAQSARADHGRGNWCGGLPAPAEGDHDAAGCRGRSWPRSPVRPWCWSATATNSRRHRCRGR